jgi:competence CoiA-like predicted nuclease
MSKIPFGEKFGKMYEPHQISKGLICGCICPECKGKLIAKHGNKVIKHFAHHSWQNCTGGRESAIHKTAKQILMNHKKLLVPSIYIHKKIFR